MLEYPSALLMLLFLIPVIILYILKPKPKTHKIPSLMLLISPEKKRGLRSLFKTLVHDPLLLLQLFVITILVLTMVNPYFSINAPYENTMIVLDNSASMSANDVIPNRFSKGVDIASGYITGSRSSLILAGETPLLLFKDLDHEKAIVELRSQKPVSTGSDLNDAMLLAAELMDRTEGKLVVISDFSGQDITYSRKIIEARNIAVEYRQVGAGGTNAGIVEASVESGSVKFAVKNYNAAIINVIVRLDNGISQTRKINPGSREYFNFPIHPGKNIISLEPGDELAADNFLYISMPAKMKRKVLILSDKVEKSPISTAFNSIPGVEVDEAAFIRAPRKPDHSIVVLRNYLNESLLPGTIDDLKSFTEEGGTLVFVATEDLISMDTKGLLPVEVAEMAKPSVFQVARTDLTVALEFGVSGYLNATLKNGAVELASGPQGPVLAYWNIGRGRVFYLGLNDRWGDFHLQASYPIFWYRLLESSFPAANELNFKTGNVLPLGTLKAVATPHSNIETSELYLDETGFYSLGDRIIAANLLDEKESDINVKMINDTDYEKSYGTKVKKVHLDVLFSILAIILVVLELYYLKHRGDI